jgi:hypothetical protein
MKIKRRAPKPAFFVSAYSVIGKCPFFTICRQAYGIKTFPTQNLALFFYRIVSTKICYPDIKCITKELP